MSTNYVLGFAFDAPMRRVLLIQKKRPKWQDGFWNGVGGHLEAGETGPSAMAREFLEETGISVPQLDFECVARMSGKDFVVFVYKTVLSEEVFNSHKTMTDEWVMPHDLGTLIRTRGSQLYNIPHLVGLCLDRNLDGPQEISYATR